MRSYVCSEMEAPICLRYPIVPPMKCQAHRDSNSYAVYSKLESKSLLKRNLEISFTFMQQLYPTEMG